jgi:small subunit ribosomal protein S4
MGRFTGPKAKIARREGSNIFGLQKITRILTKRNYPPGIHGPASVKSRKKETEFGLQLRSKQMVKRTYGIRERQFSNYFKKAANQKGDTEYNFKKLLELRFDNIVYRMGFTQSRAQARQLIVHGHFTVNGKKIDIPSYEVKVGDEITVRTKSKESPVYGDMKEDDKDVDHPVFVAVDAKNLKGKLTSIPPEEYLKDLFDGKLIIEFYSR